MYNTMRERFAKINAKKKELLKYYPNLTDESGIYILYRYEENLKYAYVGQAKQLLRRLAEHFFGYQHIDNSLKKRKIYTAENEGGYRIHIIPCAIADLDEKERFYIERASNMGFQLYNKTTGGQDSGKRGMENAKSPKGYYDGKKQGYEDCKRDVKRMFKYLDYSVKGKSTKIKEKYFAIFKEFLEETGKND